MGKARTFGLPILLLALLTSCAQAPRVKPGAAAGEGLIKLLPRSAGMVLGLNGTKLMATSVIAEVLQDPKIKAGYDAFVTISGIDPKKDIRYAVIWAPDSTVAKLVSGPTQQTVPEDFGLVVDLKYERTWLQRLIEMGSAETKAKTEIYNGLTVYAIPGNAQAEPEVSEILWLTLLDTSHIVLGYERAVKGAIDVYQRKAESLTKNLQMNALLRRTNKAGIAWLAFAYPTDHFTKLAQANPILRVFENIKYSTMTLDQRGADFVVEIQNLGGTKEQNATIASVLMAMKTLLGPTLTNRDPALEELMKTVVIGSGEDFTRLTATLSFRTLEKIFKFFQSMPANLVPPLKREPESEIHGEEVQGPIPGGPSRSGGRYHPGLRDVS
jgi:hypothetical protein